MEFEDPIQHMSYLVNHLATVLARQSDQVLLEQLGIGFSQFKILQVLKKQPHIQQKKIAAHLGQTEASISRQIKIMMQDGLLTARVSSQNRREHITTLTPRGERFVDESIRILNKYQQDVFACLGGKQSQFISHLEQMHNAAACHCS